MRITPRLFVAFLAGTVIGAFTIVLLKTYSIFLPTLATGNPSGISKEEISTSTAEGDQPIQSKKSYKCENPYLQPGYVWYKNYEEETQTTWIPFYPSLLDQSYSSVIVQSTGDPADPYTKDGDPYFPTERPPLRVLAESPHQWMQDIVRHYTLYNTSLGKKPNKPTPLTADEDHEQAELEDGLFWLRDRRVLIVSDSVDRYQSEYICNRLDLAMTHSPHGRQTASWCHIPMWNLTFMNWHIASVSPTKPRWWWIETMKIVAVEDRWKEYYLPTLNDTIGMNGKSPDLILFHSGLWDHTFFIRAPEAVGGRVSFGRSLNWRELRFYMQRIRMVINMLREQFGDDVPMICRSVTLKKSLYSNVSIMNLDRAARFVCNELGVEMMEFGDIIRGYFQFYKDMVHIDRGPLSVMWANMMFWYLFRTQGGVEVRGRLTEMPANSTEVVNVTAQWHRCHGEFMTAKRY
ncbi:hypothetical protein V1507DRAFT_462826 [Lipomyces tetrasporus]